MRAVMWGLLAYAQQSLSGATSEDLEQSPS